MFDSAVVFLYDYPWLVVIQSFVALCIASNLWTRNRTFREADKSVGTQSIPYTTHWLPWIGNGLASWLHSSTLLAAKGRGLRSRVFATTIYGRDYVVITDAKIARTLLREEKIKPEWADAETISKRFYGNPSVTKAKAARKQRMNEIYEGDKSKLKAVASLLNTHAYNLISPAQSWVDQAQWERTSGAKVVETEPVLAVSASLNTLIRDFSANILLCPLLGRSFLEANPDFIGDMFQFGSKYKSFMRGLPYWVMPGLGPPAFARERSLRALDGLVRAITAEQTGRSVAGLGDAVLYDVDEVHESILSTVLHAREQDNDKPSIRAVSSEVLEFVFETTHYYVYKILWGVVFSIRPSENAGNELSVTRKETKKILDVVKRPPSGLPFEDPPQLNFGNLLADPSKFELKCPKFAQVLTKITNIEGLSLEEFSVAEDSIAEANSDDGGVSKSRFELKRGDRVLGPLEYMSLDAIQRNGGFENDDASAARIWMVMSAILLLFEIELLQSESTLTTANTQCSISSMAEPSRDPLVKIMRKKCS